MELKSELFPVAKCFPVSRYTCFECCALLLIRGYLQDHKLEDKEAARKWGSALLRNTSSWGRTLLRSRHLGGRAQRMNERAWRLSYLNLLPHSRTLGGVGLSRRLLPSSRTSRHCSQSPSALRTKDEKPKGLTSIGGCWGCQIASRHAERQILGDRGANYVLQVTHIVREVWGKR